MIKAFTLIELIVALAITSVVSGLCFLSYTQIGKGLKNNKTALFSAYEVQLFQAQLMYDLDDCSSARLENANSIELIGPGVKRVNYEFLNEFIIRRKELTQDTFELQTTEFTPKILFDADSRVNPIEYLFINVEIENELIPLAFSKKYPAVQLMQYEEK